MKLNSSTDVEVTPSSGNIANAVLGAVISTINYDEQKIIRDILYLHCEGNDIDCDPTFSVGNFYKKGLKKPLHCFDKSPQVDNVIQATSDNIPLDSNSCNVIMFDPPFLIGGKIKDGDKRITANRFTLFSSFEELKQMYSASLKEFSRLLKDNGTVIFKCQDTVVGGKQHFSHCWVMYEAIKNGFYPKDLFVLLAKHRMPDKRKQQHARKYHCYYWVFKKTKCSVRY